MRRSVLAVALVAMVALAGCSAISGDQSDGAGDSAVPDERVAVADDGVGATDVNQTLRVRVDETTADSEWTEFGATYPREHFTVDSAKHGAVALGVDGDGDGELDRTFDEGHVSGVNNNDYSFDVTLDTGYTLQEGDVVVVGYPAVDNPGEPGEYDVEARLNDERTTNGTVTIQ